MHKRLAAAILAVGVTTLGAFGTPTHAAPSIPDRPTVTYPKLPPTAPERVATYRQIADMDRAMWTQAGIPREYQAVITVPTLSDVEREIQREQERVNPTPSASTGGQGGAAASPSGCPESPGKYCVWSQYFYDGLRYEWTLTALYWGGTAHGVGCFEMGWICQRAFSMHNNTTQTIYHYEDDECDIVNGSPWWRQLNPEQTVPSTSGSDWEVGTYPNQFAKFAGARDPAYTGHHTRCW